MNQNALIDNDKPDTVRFSKYHPVMHSQITAFVHGIFYHVLSVRFLNNRQVSAAMLPNKSTCERQRESTRPSYFLSFIPRTVTLSMFTVYISLRETAILLRKSFLLHTYCNASTILLLRVGFVYR